jgi:hypothetical protein
MTDASGVRSPTGSCVDYARVFAPVTPASGLRASQDAFHTTRVTIEHARETRDGRACCSTRAESPGKRSKRPTRGVVVNRPFLRDVVSLQRPYGFR